MKRFALIFCLFATALLATQSVKTVNGLAIASVKTVDQLAIASVKTVAGLDNTSSGGALPLDSYSTNLLAAYSVPRRLLTSYTGPLIKIRRSSDDATVDVGYNGSNELDAASQAAWVSSNSAYIEIIYDQTGNGRHFITLNNSTQMRIVNAGTLDTLGGKPTAYNHTGANNSVGYYTSTFTTYSGTTLSCFARGLTGNGSATYARFIGVTKDSSADYTASSRAALILQTGSDTWTTYRGADLGNTIATPASSDGLISAIADGTNLKLRDGTHTGSAASSASWDINRLLIGFSSASTSEISLATKCSEVVFWTSDQTANEAAIRSALAY